MRPVLLSGSSVADYKTIQRIDLYAELLMSTLTRRQVREESPTNEAYLEIERAATLLRQSNLPVYSIICYQYYMHHYKDLDTLYDFLKNITSVEEFFERKEPCFGDDVSRQFAEWSLDNGEDPDIVLGALKANERQRYAESRKERERPH